MLKIEINKNHVAKISTGGTFEEQLLDIRDLDTIRETMLQRTIDKAYELQKEDEDAISRKEIESYVNDFLSSIITGSMEIN